MRQDAGVSEKPYLLYGSVLTYDDIKLVYDSVYSGLCSGNEKCFISRLRRAIYLTTNYSNPASSG